MKRASKRFLARSPNWLRTAAIAKPPKPARIRGTFGAASPVTRIDPKSGLPMEPSE